MYEHRRQRPLPRNHFTKRLVHHGLLAFAILAVSMAIGTAGYHWLAGFSWIDSLLNSAMLLGGMGPVGELPTTAGKLFATVFALYAGMVFLVLASLMMAPVFHRVLHKFHWEADQRGGGS